jgi:hypothetical protein
MRSLTILFALAAVAAAQDQSPFLGVGVEPVDAQLRRDMHVPGDVEGVMITALVTPSAASRAGLRLGDIIVSFAGKPVTTREGLVELIRAHKPGDRVPYLVRRGTGVIDGKLRLGVEEEGASMTHLRTDAEPPPPAGEEAEAEAPGLKRRLDKVQEEVETLRRRVQAKREEARRREHAKRGAPDGLEGWIHREELGLAEARKRGAERKVAFHEARLALLREMRGAEVRVPTARIDRLEKKLDAILALLRKKEK